MARLEGLTTGTLVKGIIPDATAVLAGVTCWCWRGRLAPSWRSTLARANARGLET